MSSNGIDLNKLRAEIVKTRERGDTVLPSFKVSSEGKIVSGTQTRHSPGQPLSDIPAETFALTLSDRISYRSVMPRNAKLREIDGVPGIYYTVISEFDDRFVFFLYQQGGYYQVKVVYPEIENRWRDPHTGHLFSDGRICFGHSYEAGMPTMQGAFSKSVLWTQGMSVALRKDAFPF